MSESYSHCESWACLCRFAGFVAAGIVLAAILLESGFASEALENNKPLPPGDSTGIAEHPSGSDCDTPLNRALSEQIETLKALHFGVFDSTPSEQAQVARQLALLARVCDPKRIGVLEDGDDTALVRLIERDLAAAARNPHTPIFKTPLPPGELAAALSKLSARAIQIDRETHREATLQDRDELPHSAELKARSSALQVKNLESKLALLLASEVRMLWGEHMNLDLEHHRDALISFHSALQSLQFLAEAVDAECAGIQSNKAKSVPPSLIDLISISGY